jgi:hypothetical protein
MRSLLFCLAVLVSACATTQTGTRANIPATRHEIDDTIAEDTASARRTPDFKYDGTGSAAALPASRRITAMGRVEPDRAVVYTKPGATRLEETWVRGPDGWRLAHVTELGAGSGTAAASR